MQYIYTRVSQKFCNILVQPSMQHVYYMIKNVQGFKCTYCGWKYCGSWCMDLQYIDLLHVRFESLTDEHATCNTSILG